MSPAEPVIAAPGGAEPLERYLGQPLALPRFLRLAIALSEALDQVHAKGLIHQNLNPTNVLVDANGRARLTGPASGHKSGQPIPIVEPPDLIAGDPAYQAPEQTGRMNRGVDSRADLYALGIIFYRMLTGRLPFEAKDPLEWVHCHVARLPPSPTELAADIPPVVSELVMKLLAKEADERYQSARGLRHDLKCCLARWRKAGVIEPFALGRHDVFDQFRIPPRLYGREAEVAALRAAFDRLPDSGAPQLVMVSGYSGIGKSALVRELYRPVVQAHGYFIAGKFDLYRRNVPYTALIQAFEALIEQVLAESEARLADWKTRLAAALGSDAGLMVDVLPRLETLLGPQARAPALPPTEAQNRFHRLFQRLVGVFAGPAQPLVLFLDDLQWIDLTSLQLVEFLLTHPETRHLMLIGAYRDNEVSLSHPLRLALDRIAGTGVPHHEIRLGALARADLQRLVADTLHCALPAAASLAQLVFAKTGGNPFFSIQFLTMLHRDGLLAFDARRRAWTWDMAAVAAQGYTDNVAELMVGQLARLPEETQRALQLASCLGDACDLSTLGLIAGFSPQALTADLLAAVRRGLVRFHDGRCHFLHARIQEAAYGLIAETERPGVHLRIGRVLLAHTPPEQVEERVFDLVTQLNLGAALITSPEDRLRAAELNLSAARRAKAAAAFQAAADYLAAGAAMLDENGWEPHYALAYALALERAECAYLRGAFDVAEGIVPVLLQRARSRVDRAAAYRVRIDLHSIKGEGEKAIETALECLRMLGIEMPARPSKEQVQAAYEAVWNELGSRRIEDLLDLPAMTDAEMQAAMEVLARLYIPAYYADNNLFCLHLCKAVSLSLRHGHSPAATYAYGWFGVILVAVFHRPHDAWRFARLAYDLMERCRFLAYKAKAHLQLKNVGFWTQPLSTMSEHTRAAFEAAVETGDVPVACFSCSETVVGMLARGDPLSDVERAAAWGIDFARRAGFADICTHIAGSERFVRAMRGRTRRLSTYDDEGFSEVDFESGLGWDRMPSLVFYYHVLKLAARYLAGDYAAALAAGEHSRVRLWAGLFSVQSYFFHFYYALTLAACYADFPAEKQREALARLAASRDQLREWAENYPPTFHNAYALVAAELARLRGDEREALSRYEEAIGSARDNGLVHHEAIACELAAAFHRARGLETVADTYLWRARSCYARWQADGKVGQLDERYPRLKAVWAPAAPPDAGAAPVDTLAVARASQAISGEVVLDRLLDTLMRVVIQTAGAQAGWLLLVRGEEIPLAAGARVDGERIEVAIHRPPASAELPVPSSILNYVRRTREKVILADAGAANPFSGDDDLVRQGARSVLCLPILGRGEAVGLLYLENRLVTHAFTPDRLAVLELIAAQAAISLANAMLYADLERENSERRRAQAAEGESRARLAAILGSALDAIITVDAGQRILLFNAAAERMFGWPAEQVIGESIDRLIPERFRTAHRAHLQRFGESGMTHRIMGEAIEVVGRRANGEEFPIDASISQAESGGQKLFTVMLRDVSERKRVEAEQRAREAAEAASRAKSEFLANMSHELRSPLNTILGFARLAAREPGLPDRLREDLGLILKSGKHLLALINDVLDLSKLEAGRATLNEAEVDLDFLLDELRDTLTPAAVDKGLDLVFATHAQVPGQIRTDPLKLRQVLINLISNAIKFTSRGSVTVRVEAKPIAETASTVRLVFAVADSGSGIAADELPQLFTAFAQAKAGRQAREGTGLGLAISRRFVELMGGEMAIDSQVGQGTTVRFEIPVRVVEKAARGRAPARRPEGLAPGQRRYRLLVADDRAEARQLLVRILAPLGFELQEAVDGEEAIERWQAWHPDLIWMDIRMPGLDGREAARRIRAAQQAPQPVIVALTASSFDDERSAILAAGCNDFLRKPFAEEELFGLLERQLGVRFVYPEEAPAAPRPPDAQALAALPEGLRERLSEALVRLDTAAVDEAIDALKELDAQLADTLAAYAGNFDYDRLLSLIEASQRWKLDAD